MKRSNSGELFLAESSNSDVRFHALLHCVFSGPFEIAVDLPVVQDPSQLRAP
jgi:hypothetical protein